MTENDFLIVSAVCAATSVTIIRVTVAVLRHKASQAAADRKLKGAQS